MMMKKLLSAVCVSALILAACTACGSGSSAPESSKEEATTAQTTEATAEAVPQQTTTKAAEPAEIEEAVVAESGDAFLFLNDGGWIAGYDGSSDTIEKKSVLTYGAGVAKITGDGDYTVSVDVSTNGAQYEIARIYDYPDYVAENLQFAAVKVVDGTKLFPNMTIEITAIRADGKDIELTAKNYTSSDDGVEMRSNIYNQWVKKFPEDARDAEGNAVTGDFGEYSSEIIDAKHLGKWSKLEVDFTVRNTGSAAEAPADTTAPAETEAAAETTTAAAQ